MPTTAIQQQLAKGQPSLSAGIPESQWNPAVSQMLAGRPKGAPPVVVEYRPGLAGAPGKQYIAVGKWNTPPTGNALAGWNAWMKQLGVPENTFGQFFIDPAARTYSMYTPYDPKGKQTYSQWAKNALGPWTALGAPASTTPAVKAAIPTGTAPSAPPVTQAASAFQLPAYGGQTTAAPQAPTPGLSSLERAVKASPLYDATYGNAIRPGWARDTTYSQYPINNLNRDYWKWVDNPSQANLNQYVYSLNAYNEALQSHRALDSGWVPFSNTVPQVKPELKTLDFPQLLEYERTGKIPTGPVSPQIWGAGTTPTAPAPTPAPAPVPTPKPAVMSATAPVQTTTGFNPFQLPSYGAGSAKGIPAGSPVGATGGIRTMAKPSFNLPAYYDRATPFLRRQF